MAPGYDLRVRTGVVIAALIGLSAPAFAQRAADRFEWTGFFGTEVFPADTGLGNSAAPEQKPETSPLFGMRLTWIAVPGIRRGEHTRLDLGLEGELALATAWTGFGFMGPRESYFSPVFDYRALVMLRLAGLPGGIAPHAEVGWGWATVVSSSPYMAKETDPEFLMGLGATLFVHHWQLRADVRDGLMPSHGPGVSNNWEASIGIGASFGLPRKPPPAVSDSHEVTPPEPDKDTDKDGIPDRLDGCPAAPESVNGVEDEDGCPEADPDGDGIVGAADKCPMQPEDFDHFQDDDGCPDPDNDNDGIPDALDACPDEPETFNGYNDDDGCPDKIPPEVDAALATASAVKFEPNRARITAAAKKSLTKLVAVLRDRSGLRIQIVGHMEKTKGPTDKAQDLAKKRADAVKWYLVDQGVAEDQVVTGIADPDKAVIEVKLYAAPRKAPPSP